MRLLSTIAAVLLVSAVASAQLNYRAELSGSNEVPPNASAACGWARVTLNPNNSVTYDVRMRGLSATAAHIHAAPVGVNGGVIVALSGGPTSWAGTSAPLTAGQVADLRAGDTYINVHTAAFPGGEVRGQIVPETDSYAAHCVGAQENPPVASAATADVDITVNPNRSLTYTVTAAGVSGTAAHIHAAPVGSNGGVVFPLSGGPTVWSGTTAPMTAAQYDTLDAQGFYVNIHSAANPGGEIRGQIIPAGVNYFDDPTCVDLSLDIGGAPAPGATVDFAIAGGASTSVGYLLASLAPDLATLNGEALLLNPGLLFITTLVLPLDASGELGFSFAMPPFGVGGSIYWQFFNLDATAPNGKFRISNGVEQRLVALP